QLGIEHYQRGEFTEAIAAWQRSLARSRTLGNRQNEAAALGNLGIAHRVLGDYVRAIEYLNEALRIKRELAERQGEGQLLVNLGNVYENLGEYDRTLQFYENSLPILQEVGDLQSETIVLNNLGSLYANLNEPEKAIEHSQTSLEIARQIGDRQGIGQSYLNLGLVYHTLGQIQPAINNYRESLTIAGELDLPLLKIPASSNLALAYEQLNDRELAIEYHQYGLMIAREIYAPREEAKVLNNFAHTLLKFDRLPEAETQLRRSIQLLDTLRKDLNDAQIVSIFDTQIHTYNLLQQVLIAQNKPEAALEISEWGRARAFTQLLIQRKSDRPLPETLLNPDPPNLDRIRQVARHQNATLVEYSIVPDDSFLHRGKLWGNKADRLYIWVVQPSGKIDFRSVNLTSLTTPLESLIPDTRQTIGIRGIASPSQLVLVPGDLVRLQDDAPGWEPWSVVAVDEANGTVSLTQSSFPPGVTIDRPIADVVAIVDDLRTTHPQLQKLHQLLIEPIADLLPQKPDDRIIFIPHRELFVVPFAALQNTEGTYLIEQHTMLSAPAIQVLELTQTKPSFIPPLREDRGGSEILIVGNPTMPSIALTPGDPPQPLAPLPNAEREAEEIAQLWQTSPLLGDRATKAEILPQLPQAQLVHLATHGLLDARSGIGSAIALAPSANDDGWLTAKEILGLDLQADLVVLSACNTGQGQITGDGVIGLSRSFLSAGASSVIVSLWMVPDAPTADLMRAFYQNLQQNPDRATALRQAMLTTMKRHPQPKNWAAFVLMGNG
ncbi:MAG TPA: CHAT domain-containing protein, partial [Oscillatoriales cyanobacterium M59_W2019_021]|nr:CHAT domain-containing protein [Oscillatoriales cyanobacterium M59_W2019_021]